ncbi:MAG: tyrosine--tRNA ligase [Rhodothermales bacterium]|nr:tyrosine--tRNA ligase [Rhodothermales bacterium]
MSFLPPEEQLRQLRRGVEEILPEADLLAKLKKSYETNTPLVVKLGADPSRPDLHLGHAVVLRKLRQFQDLGHKAILIVGDFTGMIGDPSGKSKTRPALTLEETRVNGQSYFEQAGRILDLDRAGVVYNSEWLAPMSFADVIHLASKYTVARMLERDEFDKRFKANEPIAIHEFLYPLAQALDSVAIKADVELGGTDQKFNLLVGREIMSRSGMEPQVCMTLPILEGLDGVEKMSKSLDNYIGITEAPEQMYGKVLSIPDALIARYYTFATDASVDELPALHAFAAANPRDAKHDVAHRVVALYHGAEAADAARDHFEKTVIRKELPDEMPEIALDAPMPLVDALVQHAGVASKGEARRLVQQGGVQVNGEKATDPMATIDPSTGPVVVKAGKRTFVRFVAA